MDCSLWMQQQAFALVASRWQSAGAVQVLSSSDFPVPPLEEALLAFFVEAAEAALAPGMALAPDLPTPCDGNGMQSIRAHYQLPIWT